MTALRSTRLPLLVVLAAVVVGCAGPPSHMARLWPRGRTGLPMLGVAVNNEVLVLSRPHFQIGDRFEIQFPVGNSTVIDVGEIDRVNNNLAVVRPFTARLQPARLAESLPESHELLHLALRDADDAPEMVPVERWRDGAHGDWILLPGHDARKTAKLWAGAGMYVERKGRWRLVGILAGITAELPDDPDQSVALGYIGLLEIARVLPEELEFFEREPPPLRPDFEFGVPLQPGDLALPPETQPEPEAEESGAT